MDRNDERSVVPRQAAKLTLGVWIFTFILFLMPGIAANGRIPQFAVGMTALVVGFGIALSVLLYWACARLRHTPPPLRIAGVFGAVCLAAFAFSLGDALLGGNVIRLFMSEHHVRPDVINRTVSNFISFSWLYGWLGTTYVILQTQAAMRKRDLQLAEARALAQTAQLTALRLQLNPHFLFNTLNAISSLIVTGRNKDGEAMLSKLCGFLRTALAADGRTEVTLEEEMETLQTYLEIEAIRFGDRLTVEFAAADDLLDLPVPNFILQPLVENAIKHGVAPTSRPVVVRVGARREGRDLILSVSDNGGIASVGTPATGGGGAGVGLDNTRRRLEVTYGPRARLETLRHDGGFTAFIRLPAPPAGAIGLVA
ncbi:MAG: two-component system, LytTR family, sensor kinase [Sphingomonadales bacterium]|nr:two-component system, LytTR family, sensor kinase [Sphingomonadales bacterium]